MESTVSLVAIVGGCSLMCTIISYMRVQAVMLNINKYLKQGFTINKNVNMKISIVIKMHSVISFVFCYNDFERVI